METTDKKFTEFISKLQRLKKLAKQYQAKWPNYPFSGDINHSGNGFWQKKTHLLVNDIDLELDELWELIKKHTSPEDNFAGRYAMPTSEVFAVNLSGDIKHVIDSREPNKVDALIQLLKKVQHRHHVKADLTDEKTKKTEMTQASGELDTKKQTEKLQPVKQKQDDEVPVRIETAIVNLKISHSRVKQAAKKEEIHSKRAGTKKNSPYLVFKSEVEKKFVAHGQK